MKLKTLFRLLLAIIFGITNQLVFGMELMTKELKPAHVIALKEVFSLKSVAFDQKKRGMVHVLLSHQGNNYLTSYNSQTTQLTQYNYPLKEKSRKLKLFMHNNADRLPKILGSHSLNYKNNAVEIWSTATKEHLYTLSHGSPIVKVIINNSKTQMITMSVGNKINIWQLKKPIIFSCGQDKLFVEDTQENRNILSQSEAIKNMFDALDGADLDSEIPLACINNQEEFDNLFSFMKLIYKNNREGIKTKLNKLNVNQLCSLIKISSYYGIASENINLTDIIYKIILNKYDSTKDQLCVKQLLFHYQNMIAQGRVTDFINYIDNNTKPLFSFIESAGEPVNFLTGHTDDIKSVAFSQDSKRIVTTSYDKSAKIWDAQTGKCLHTFSDLGDLILAAFSQDGKAVIPITWVAAETYDMAIWHCMYAYRGDIGSFRSVRIGSNIFPVSSVAISPNGKAIVSGFENGEIRIYDAIAGKCLEAFNGHVSIVWSIVVSPDGKTLASGDDYGIVKIWDMKTGECLQAIQGHIYPVYSVAINPNGKTFASGDSSGVVKIWDMKTGKCLQTITGHATNFFCSVFFSSNGKMLATGSKDKAARIWDVATGKCLQAFQGNTNIDVVAFSPNDEMVVAGSWALKIVSDATKQAFLKNLTIEQADFLIEKVYPAIKEGIIFTPKVGSKEYEILNSISLEAQEYLHNYVLFKGRSIL